MSIKERPRAKKEEKETNKKETLESVNEWLDKIEIDPEKAVEKKTIEKIKTKASVIEIDTKEIVKVETKEINDVQLEPEIDIFVVKLPPWINKPWMYVQPTHLNQLGSWINSWSTLILDYSRSYRIHIINITQLMKVYPFSNPDVSKNLTLNHMNTIIEKMVDENLAKWLDETKISVRIYYLTNLQWAEKIMKYLIGTGYAAEIMTFFELQNLDQEWSTLPKISQLLRLRVCFLLTGVKSFYQLYTSQHFVYSIYMQLS